MTRPAGNPACASCGSERVARSLYGLPASFAPLQPDLDAGRVILGGCCCSDDEPQWRCLACGHGWGQAEHLAELHRLMREAELRPRSRWQRVRGWLGLTFEDATVLGGLARRLACAAAGAGVVLAAGSVAPAWVGLTVLAVWFLPLLCHAGLRQFAVLLGCGLVALAGVRALPQVLGPFAAQVFEECVLVLTVALLGGWLL
jgi:hypothetical protein